MDEREKKGNQPHADFKNINQNREKHNETVFKGKAGMRHLSSLVVGAPFVARARGSYLFRHKEIKESRKGGGGEGVSVFLFRSFGRHAERFRKHLSLSPSLSFHLSPAPRTNFQLAPSNKKREDGKRGEIIPPSFPFPLFSPDRE